MEESVLSSDDLSVIYFRVSYDLGLAVEACHLEIARALAKKREKSRFDFLIDLSRDLLDCHVHKLKDSDYDDHITFIRKKIQSDMPAARKNPELAAAYEKLLRTVRPSSIADLEHRLNTLAEQAFQEVQNTVLGLGGEKAKQRWGLRKVARINFLKGEPGPTRSSFRRGNGRDGDAIVIHVGSHLDSANSSQKGALRTYFLLDFNFCHEYLSHSFCAWDDQEHFMTEGVLVWLAREFVPAIRTDNLRYRFAVETLARRADPVSTKKAEFAADWFHRTADNKGFLFYILEWAASDGEVDREEKMKNLIFLADVGHVGKNRLINDIKDIFSQSGGRPALENVHAQLGLLARACFPPYENFLPPLLESPLN